MRVFYLLVCLVLLVGCTPSVPGPSPSAPSPSAVSPTPSLSPSLSPSPSPTVVESFPPAPASESGEIADIRAGWEAYESTRDMYYRDPDLKDDFYALSIVTTGGETSRAVGAIAKAREMNLKQRGHATFREVVIDDPTTDENGVRRAVVHYCSDPVRLDMVDTKTGESVPRSKTLAAQVTMELVPDGSWRASDYASKFEPC